MAFKSLKGASMKLLLDEAYHNPFEPFKFWIRKKIERNELENNHSGFDGFS